MCNRVNHTICYIKNRNDDNETELNVGKDCIKHFPNLTDDDNKYYDIVEQVKEIQKPKILIWNSKILIRRYYTTKKP